MAALILIPAYGKVCRTVEEILTHWNSGKDFYIVHGPYCSVRDIDKLTAMGEDIYLSSPAYNVVYRVFTA